MGNEEIKTQKKPGPYRYGWTLASFIMLGIMVVIGIATFGTINNTRAVTFNLDGDPYTYRYKVGEYADLPIPNKAGHTFVGWYVDIELTEPFNSHITKKTTLYARFEKNLYTITVIDTKNLEANPLYYDFEYGTVVILPSYSTPNGDIWCPQDEFFAGYHTKMYNHNLYSSIQVSQNITLYTQYDPFGIPAGTENERVMVEYDLSLTDYIQFHFDAMLRLLTSYTANTSELFMLENLYAVLPINDGSNYYVFDGWCLPDGSQYHDGWGVDLGEVIKNPENYTTDYPSTDHYMTTESNHIKIIVFTAKWKTITLSS